eukprot:CAMPEP_0170649672 /NCGR_PEP_ID=MMETSP0224-20130122/45414_1 /TAXON_ID=285029 /ORGANISM="Togula jolla, Strain CCCM 725" /LENGTH=123 /DNA_ID=CAMNT_0010981323 /DNA_START=118 /DNA_END=489 /DNA_ORIENTATION=-
MASSLLSTPKSLASFKDISLQVLDCSQALGKMMLHCSASHWPAAWILDTSSITWLLSPTVNSSRVFVALASMLATASSRTLRLLSPEAASFSSTAACVACAKPGHCALLLTRSPPDLRRAHAW